MKQTVAMFATLAEAYRALPDELTLEARAEIEALAPSAADYADDDLMRYMQIVNDEGAVCVTGACCGSNYPTLNELGIDATGDDAVTFAAVAEIGTCATLSALYPLRRQCSETGIANLIRLEMQLRELDEINEAELFTSEMLADAITERFTCN